MMAAQILIFLHILQKTIHIQYNQQEEQVIVIYDPHLQSNSKCVYHKIKIMYYGNEYSNPEAATLEYTWEKRHGKETWEKEEKSRESRDDRTDSITTHRHQKKKSYHEWSEMEPLGDTG